MAFPFSTTILQGVVLTFFLVHGATGLQCLECEEVYNQDDCALVGTCGNGEVCFTRRVNNFRDRPAYRMGCEDRDVCEFFKTHQSQGNTLIGRRAADGALCRQCCEHNYCNSELCRETPTQSTHITEPTTSVPIIMRDCMEYLHKGYTSGVYTIKPDDLPPFDIYCDMKTAGGGWMVVQRRFNGSLDFARSWNTYKHGFGSLDGEFWLGNEYLHRLTNLSNTSCTLRFQLTSENGTEYYAEYADFTVAAEDDGFRMSFNGYQGNAGDSFRMHRGLQFSTADHDQDTGVQNCAALYQGGWWYYDCYQVNINGVYGTNGDVGIKWLGVTGWTGSLRATAMSIRPAAA